MNIDELYKTIAPKLTNWLVSTGSPYHQACDLVQETFLKIWKMREDLRDSVEAAKGLAFTIAKNLRKNLIRDDCRITFVEEIRDEDAGSVAPHMPESEIEAERAALRKKLLEALSRLAPPLREAYTLFQIAGRSINEIARECGIGESLVKVRIFRAKEKLRKILSEMGVTL